MTQIASLDVQRRLPVWHALSDVFLDTELQARDYHRIARTLDISGYSLAELRSILEDEVAPAFASNLWSVTGEWAGWSENDVQTIMLKSLSRRRLPLLSWLKWLMRRRHIEQEWEKIEQFLKQG
ncbi:hypothetical protein CO671_12480 [Rhizobium sp. M10]|uniref:DUF7079 family protein n=1 Tax=Rhizobium sp. M10 TaxID=1324586 RepID=UPI000BEAC663|nr:hypothetical protein [Rhizobium sp. M10]PDT36437.1 hypothetical protein CO671_12480 [Rhizobium sp. M10]